MPELWLIRHGQSEGNVRRAVTGLASDPLTEYGRSQVTDTANWLKGQLGLEPDYFFSSTMRRAVETAELLSMSCDFSALSELNETDAGEVSNWKRRDFDDVYDDFWSPFDPTRKFPSGESHMELYQRVNNCVDNIIARAEEGDRILMAVHGGTISSIFHKAFSVPMKHFSKFVVGNASLSILSYSSISSVPDLKAFNLQPPERVV
jgi:broad specificity phosphatase PhoE